MQFPSGRTALPITAGNAASKSSSGKAAPDTLTRTPTTKATGDDAEELALAHLTRQGLRLVTRNYRTPGRGGGEIDLVMRDRDGTLVFVEVRKRASRSHGGAAGSVSFVKQRRIVYAAQHYISRLAQQPPCRFDVVSVEGKKSAGDQAGGGAAEVRIEWLRAAFDAQ